MREAQALHRKRYPWRSPTKARQGQSHQDTALTPRRRFVLGGEDDEAKSFILLPLQTDVVDLWAWLVGKVDMVQPGRAVLCQDRLWLVLHRLLFPLQGMDKQQIRNNHTKQLQHNHKAQLSVPA